MGLLVQIAVLFALACAILAAGSAAGYAFGKLVRAILRHSRQNARR